MMKILNIHGYHGTAHNSAYAALEALGCNIVSPELDYDKETPEQIITHLMQMIADNRPDAVVGTSLGGFYAALLSARKSIPVILVNPCLMPFLHLPELGYTGSVKPFLPMFGELAKLESRNISTIVGGSDEVIESHDVTKMLTGNRRYRVIPEGKHSGATLPLEGYFKEMLQYISEEFPKRQPVVSIYSRKKIEAVIASGKFPNHTAVISFYDPAIKRLDKTYTHVDYNGVCEYVYLCEVDDLDMGYLGKKGLTYETYFTDVDEMAAFIHKVYKEGLDIICQCEYGQSRSAACAAAIREYFYHTGISVFADYQYYPNQIIYNKLFAALQKAGE